MANRRLASFEWFNEIARANPIPASTPYEIKQAQSHRVGECGKTNGEFFCRRIR